ncbi:zinc ribbon domain-containing protein [Paraburkholderia guartelaensis]|uniref:Zinc ribbon domain-containing protein n=1 Tax=Paraburkholderia guartelaensis TaxID=2546446 RepID=A0A4V2ZUP7_9BURK|nr:zinc ribbon domain-containing protein [Paraburkholderia guartelaensis]TDG01952.1 zinc ribbon domain-containing protein [Paraburkholderia guartelaensis]
MPLYDYVCRNCNLRFETLVRANSLASCPRCSGNALDKEVSAPSAPPRNKALITAARSQAAREGHLSNYSVAERVQLLHRP